MANSSHYSSSSQHSGSVLSSNSTGAKRRRRRSRHSQDTTVENFFTKRLTPHKKPILCILILLSLLVIYQAFCLMMADIYAYQTKRMIERWESNGEIQTQASLDHAYSNIRKARNFAPDFPQYIEYDALIRKWHASSINFLPEENPEQAAQALIRQTLGLYEELLVQSPTWPYAWSSYAHTKVLLGEVDEKFAFALDRAFYYGPWESQVQYEIINAGLGAWSKASLETKKLVFKTFGYAFQGNRFMSILIAKAKERNIFAVLCMKPEKDSYTKHVKKECEKALASFGAFNSEGA